MTAEEAMDRIGNVMETFYAGKISTWDALNQIAQIRGAYLVEAGQ
jgi:hypothetical protein